MKFKLIDLIDDRTKLDVCRNVKGYTKYCYVVLEPGITYDTEGDELFEKTLRNAKFKKPYSHQTEDILKRAGVVYSIESCKTCGGRVKKLVYNPIEEVK